MPLPPLERQTEGGFIVWRFIGFRIRRIVDDDDRDGDNWQTSTAATDTPTPLRQCVSATTEIPRGPRTRSKCLNFYLP